MCMSPLHNTPLAGSPAAATWPRLSPWQQLWVLHANSSVPIAPNLVTSGDGCACPALRGKRCLALPLPFTLALTVFLSTLSGLRICPFAFCFRWPGGWPHTGPLPPTERNPEARPHQGTGHSSPWQGALQPSWPIRGTGKAKPSPLLLGLGSVGALGCVISQIKVQRGQLLGDHNEHEGCSQRESRHTRDR